MGVETPLTVDAAVTGSPVTPQPRQHTVLAARAIGDLPAGTSFRVEGHHHEIQGVAPVIVDRELAVEGTSQGASPYHLLSGAALTRPVAAGELVRSADLSGVAPEALAIYTEGLTR
jgi:predicted homoserine dehydrogenase-like protein